MEPPAFTEPCIEDWIKFKNLQKEMVMRYAQAQKELRNETRHLNKILLIHTGGTIGMITHHHQRELSVNSKHAFRDYLFKLCDNETSPFRFFKNKIDVIDDIQFDSSQMVPQEIWPKLAETIQTNLALYRGIVITHGTDTLAYTAAAMTFLLKHLKRPVILTGAQIPLMENNMDNDAVGNLWGACQLAYHDREDIWLIPEVCAYFNRKVLRGTHLVKSDASGMDAFDTPRASILGQYTSNCTFNLDLNLIGYICLKRLVKSAEAKRATLEAVDALERRSDNLASVCMLHLYPGFHAKLITLSVDHTDVKGIVLRSYGAGNGPNLQNEIQSVAEKGVVVVNVTECQKGEVNPTYKASDGLKGAASLGDMTAEAAFAKLWTCLNYKFYETEDESFYNVQNIVKHMQTSWRGETSKSDSFALYKESLAM